MFLPFELTLRPSRVYAAALAAGNGLALLGVWLAAVPVWLQALMSVALALGVLWSWRSHSRRPRGLRVRQSGQVELLDDEWREARISGRPVVLPWLVSLAVAVEGGRTHRIALLPDSADAEGLRKFRVWLKWKPAGE